MFSSNALIQIVFANDKDIYFWGGLFKTDLNRYLWYELHDKYNTVYFVDRDEKNDITVTDDAMYSDSFKAGGFWVGKPETRLAKWLRKQLREKKNTSAVVFSMETFCEVFQNESGTLDEIRESKEKGDITGTIVLVVSPDAEKAKELLLNSPVFKYLDENAVLCLRDKKGSLYSLLKSRKQEACIFLNIFSRERISDMLIYLVFEDGSRFTDTSDLESMTDYLTQYMNNQYMQMMEKRLYKKDFSLVGSLYRDVYLQLKERNIWNELHSRSVEYKGHLLEALNDNYVDENTVTFLVSYHDETIEMRCMKLCFAGAKYDDIYDIEMIDNLNKIYKAIVSSENKRKSKEIEEKINEFIDKLEKTRDHKDSDTCGRIIAAILFGVKWLYAGQDNQEEVMKIINEFDVYIKTSSDYYKMKKDYNPAVFYHESLEQKMEQYRRLLEQLDTVISTGVINLTMMNTSDLFRNMQQIMNDFELTENLRNNQDSLVISQTALKRNTLSDKKNSLPDGIFDPSVPT